MTWKSHIAIAAAVTLPLNPAMLPAAILGSTAPDWSEWILKFFNKRVEHRGFTHYLVIPLGIILAGAVLSLLPTAFPLWLLVLWFGVGYLTHWFADACTVTGVPVAPGAAHRVHFFGGALRTGDFAEYVWSFGLLALSVLVFMPNMERLSFGMVESRSVMDFSVYHIDYGDLYEKGIIDELEYRENRWRLF